MPPQTFPLAIQPPLRGVVRRQTFQLQAPFSAYSSVDFWPHDARTGRQLSATRPPLVAFSTPGEPVNMLCRLSDPEPTIVAAAEGVLYVWKNRWVAIDSSVEIATEFPVAATPFLKKVVIANGGTPLVYNAADNTLALLVASEGTLPNDPRVVATWQGGVWFGGSPEAPHQIIGTRTGDETDLDFSATDSGGAFAGTGENEGLIGEPIRAMVPHTADTMIVAGTSSLFAMRGHPRRGGMLENVDDKIGILGQFAWTKTPGDHLYFMSKAGLGVLLPNAGAVPTLVSRERIPDELIGLTFDPDNPNVCLRYDPRWNCIYITVRGTDEQAWYYDLDSGGMYQFTMDEYPMVTEYFGSLESNVTSGVLFGGYGYGGLAHFDTEGAETLVTAPKQLVGPVKISENITQASIVQEIKVTLDTDMYSGDGSVTLYTGETAQQAVKNAESDVELLKHEMDRDDILLNHGTDYLSLRGHAAVLAINGSTDLANPLNFHGADLILRPGGRNVVLQAPTLVAKPTPAQGYAWAVTPAAGGPADQFTGFSFFTDLSRLPAAWWALPRADGGDIRPRQSNGTPLPFDLIEFNKTTKTGFLVYKKNHGPSPFHIRIHAGNSALTLPAANDAIGSDNAYDSSTLAFYPDGAGNDRTSNANHLTMSGGVTVGGELGPFGSMASLYDGANDYGQKIGGLSLPYPVTLSGWFKVDSDAALNDVIMGINYTNNGATNSLFNSHRIRPVSGRTLQLSTLNSAGSSTNATTVNAYNLGNFVHFGARIRSTTSRIIAVGGNTGNVGVVTTSASLTTPDSIIVGARTQLTPATEFFAGQLSLLRVDTADRTYAWLAYNKAMQDQLVFYGAWGFVEGNYS